MRRRKQRKPRVPKTKAWKAVSEAVEAFGTEKKLADHCEVSQSMVNQIVNLIQRPGLQAAFKISNKLGFPVDWWNQPHAVNPKESAA